MIADVYYYFIGFKVDPKRLMDIRNLLIYNQKIKFNSLLISLKEYIFHAKVS